jgi:hypothetical protein
MLHVPSVSLARRRDDRRRAQLRERQLASFVQSCSRGEPMPATSQPEPREPRQQRPQNETASISPDWNGPLLACLDAWFDSRERNRLTRRAVSVPAPVSPGHPDLG